MFAWSEGLLLELLEAIKHACEVLLALAVVVPGYAAKESADLACTGLQRAAKAAEAAAATMQAARAAAVQTAAILLWSGAAFGVIALDRAFLVAFNGIELVLQASWFLGRALPEAATDVLGGLVDHISSAWASTKRLVHATILAVLYQALHYLNYRMPKTITPVEVDEGGQPIPPYEFLCPISGEMMRDPVMLLTGHTYELAAISQWLEGGHQTCPMTNQQLHWRINNQAFAVRNHALRILIDGWVRENCNGRDPRQKHKQREAPGIPATDSVVCFRTVPHSSVRRSP